MNLKNLYSKISYSNNIIKPFFKTSYKFFYQKNFFFDFKNFLENFEYHSSNVKNRKVDININQLKEYYDKYNIINNELNLFRQKSNEHSKK